MAKKSPFRQEPGVSVIATQLASTILAGAVIRYDLTRGINRTCGWADCSSFPNGRKLLAAESKKCPMNSQQLAFRSVIDEARVLELLHEKANARPRGPYHFCQRFMTDLRNCSLACSTPIKMGHSEEHMGQSFLA
jgi:hypothetical protein